MADVIPFAVGRTGLLVTLSTERLQTACVARGWSLSELAARARVSRPTWRRPLRGPSSGLAPHGGWPGRCGRAKLIRSWILLLDAA